MSMAKSHVRIDLRQLRYFVTAVDRGSFRKAGAAIGVRKSAISRDIRDLERHLGTNLFHRHHADVRLTEAGQAFIRDARGVFFSRLDDGFSAAQAAALGRRGRVRVAATEEVIGERPVCILTAHRARCSDVRLVLVEMIAAEQPPALRDGTVDLGLVLVGTGE